MTYLAADSLLTPATLLGRPAAAWPGLPPRTWFAESGRVALWAALRALGLGRGDRLLIPAYVCDSILVAPTALGVEVRFIPVNRQLRLDSKEVERELAAGARALLAIHYFGFPAPDLDELALLCRRHGAVLIEDCAHGLYSGRNGQPLGSFGQAAIFSLWKSLPLPDGGALVLNEGDLPPDLAALPPPSPSRVLRRMLYRALPTAESVLGFSPRLWLLSFRSLRHRMQARAAQQPLAPRAASRWSRQIVQRSSWRTIVERRRSNYLRLLEAIVGFSSIEPLFETLPAGVCPLALPILARARDQLRGRVLAAGVNVRAYWEQLPAAVSAQSYPEAHDLADRILVLPVHQTLTRHQIDYLVRVLADFEQASWPSAS